MLDLVSCSYASGKQAGQALDQREMAQGIAFKCAESLLCFTDVIKGTEALLFISCTEDLRRAFILLSFSYLNPELEKFCSGPRVLVLLLCYVLCYCRMEDPAPFPEVF